MNIRQNYHPQNLWVSPERQVGVFEASLSVSDPGDQTYYLGWTYTNAETYTLKARRGRKSETVINKNGNIENEN